MTPCQPCMRQIIKALADRCLPDPPGGILELHGRCVRRYILLLGGKP